MTAAYLRAPGPVTPQHVDLPACIGKQRYATEAEAKRAVWRTGVAARRPYRCRACGDAWHVGRGKER